MQPRILIVEAHWSPGNPQISGRFLQIKNNGQILISVINPDLVPVPRGSCAVSVGRNSNPQLLPQEACLMHISKIRSNITAKKASFWLRWLSFTCSDQAIVCSHAKSRCCISFESGRDQRVFKGEPQLLVGCSWGGQEPALLTAGGSLLPGASSYCC